MAQTRRHFLATTTAATILAAGPLRAATPLAVVATTGMIADTARRIGGDLVTVRALMGPGVDPHSYRQTRTDIVALTRAEQVLWNGLYLEAQMEDFLHDLSRRVPVDAVAEVIPVDLRLSNEDYSDRFDPHVWMDPTLWALVAAEVAATLSERRPDDVETIAANAAVFQEDLARLSTYSDEVLQSVPEAARVLVTAHDAFNYFGRAHGFEVVGIQGISTESEAGLNRISELVDMLVSRKIGAVFVESSVSDRNIRALIEGAASRGHEVTIGGELYSDAMGPDGSYEGTYLGMIDHNVTTISRALGGSAPALGMDGNLTVAS